MKTKITFLMLLFTLQITLGQENFFKKLTSHHYASQSRTVKPVNQIRHQDIVLQSLDSMLEKEWDSGTNNWVNSNKNFFTYDAYGNIIDITVLRWYPPTNLWQNSYKTSYTYNLNDKVSLITMQQWDETNSQWENDMQTTFTYDSHNLLSEKVHSQWDNNQWVPNEKYVFNFDNQGILTEKTLYLNANGGRATVNWIPYRKYTYLRDSNNRVTEETIYGWDATNQAWTEAFQNVYAYQNNLLQSETVYEWNENLLAFEERHKNEYTYDTDGYLIKNAYYDWDETNAQWQNNDQTVYIRDAQHNVVEETYMYWENNTWVNSDKYVRNYDNTYTFNDLLLPKYFYDFEITDILQLIFVHQLLEQTDYEWNSGNNNWEEWRHGDFYYSPKNISGLDTAGKIYAKIFPNPFTQIIQIQLPENLSQCEFKLYDRGGRQILTTKILQSGIINLPKLTKNMYLYKITGKNFEQTGKLIRK